MSKSKRLTLSGPSITTRAEMETLVGEITALTIQKDAATALMDEEISRVRKSFEDILSGFSEDIDEKLAVARDWAEANPSEFGDGKSIEFTQGKVGFRCGNPTLKPLSGWTWVTVLDRLQQSARSYLRTIEEVNKEALLADRELLGADKLRELGVRVVQDEKFFLEPKREALAARQLKEGA